MEKQRADNFLSSRKNSALHYGMTKEGTPIAYTLFEIIEDNHFLDRSSSGDLRGTHVTYAKRVRWLTGVYRTTGGREKTVARGGQTVRSSSCSPEM